jgi:hypothetical protein
VEKRALRHLPRARLTLLVANAGARDLLILEIDDEHRIRVELGA